MAIYEPVDIKFDDPAIQLIMDHLVSKFDRAISRGDPEAWRETQVHYTNKVPAMEKPPFFTKDLLVHLFNMFYEEDVRGLDTEYFYFPINDQDPRAM